MESNRMAKSPGHTLEITNAQTKEGMLTILRFLFQGHLVRFVVAVVYTEAPLPQQLTT